MNSCFNRSVRKDMLDHPCSVSGDCRIIGTTASISNYVDQRNKIVYVDTIGYGDVRFHQDIRSFLLFFREFICYSSIGFNWIFLCLRYEQLTQDIFIYLQSLREMLGETALCRCTIVFTHCSNPPNLNKFVEANQEHHGIVDILEKVNSIIFGDMDTGEVDADGSVTEIEVTRNIQCRKREKFLQKMLERIDNIDEKTLVLDKRWYTFYSTKMKSFLGYLFEKLFRKSNEYSKLYKLMDGLKQGIPVTIYYEECSICLDLIVEIVDQAPKACITKCRHIFHYECLEKHFKQKTNCPNCRKDLRNLPARVAGFVIGLREVQDPLKANVS